MQFRNGSRIILNMSHIFCSIFWIWIFNKIHCSEQIKHGRKTKVKKQIERNSDFQYFTFKTLKMHYLIISLVQNVFYHIHPT